MQARILMIGTIHSWHGLPRYVVSSLSLEACKHKQGNCCSLHAVGAGGFKQLMGKVTELIFRVTSNSEPATQRALKNIYRIKHMVDGAAQPGTQYLPGQDHNLTGKPFPPPPTGRDFAFPPHLLGLL